MFRSLFKKHEQDDDIFEVDPVVEQRRKEKFSTPLIYDEEFKEEEANEPDEKVESKPKAKPKTSEVKAVVEEKPKSVYQMSEVISPMHGISRRKEAEKVEKRKKVSKPKKKKNSDQLVPVISPYFGNYEEKPVIESEAKLTSINEEKEAEKLTKEIEKLPTVEENLRNIAKIVEEEKDQLKIIEERTGEFKLDFGTNEIEKQNSLIDEIDDDMSLDELMSLYEKKFKD
ncbi:MAG: hypothetical protein ACLR9T_00485 [Thomasclavelia sp.]|uniref:hypothetical protein n=1 Tax=Thomasclavelia sp. TaxID=3025757 RepID=UPI0039A3EE81